MKTFYGAPIPAYTAEELAGLDLEGLITLLMRNEDRVPRALIDECARQGEAMAGEDLKD